MFLFNLNAEIVACMLSENRATSKIWKIGGKNGGVLSMRMQVILDSSFARPGSAPIWGGKKGEFRDWTKPAAIHHLKSSPTFSVRPCSLVGRVTVDLIRRSCVQFPPRSKDFFFASCGSLLPFTRATAQWVIHGSA